MQGRGSGAARGDRSRTRRGIAHRLLWLRACVGAPKLDEQLALGCPPGWSAVHAFRARQLAAPRRRWSLARALRDAVGELRRPPRWSARVPIRRAAVEEAAEPLLELASAVTDPACRDARGIAMTTLLVCDGRSPLYAPGGSLREAAERALDALRGRMPSQSQSG